MKGEKTKRGNESEERFNGFQGGRTKLQAA